MKQYNFINTNYKMSSGYDIEEIEYILIGGGLSQTPSKPKYTQSTQVLDAFSKAGWNTSFLNSHFQYLNDTILHGWTMSQFVEKYAKQLVQSAIQKNPTSSISEILKTAGIHHRIAIDTERKCNPLIGHSYTLLQVLEYAIEYVLGFYAPLTSPSSKFFLQSDSIFEWLPYESGRIMNLPYACTYKSVSYLQKRLHTLFPPSPTSTIFFHTTNWKSISSLHKRINHRFGRQCLDFGYSPGFYVSETVDECVDWGVKRSGVWSNEIAILIFVIPKQFVYDYQTKIFSNNMLEWKEFVEKSRSCHHNDDVVVDADNSYDFIYGPMLANVDTYTVHGAKPHSPKKYQLVSKSRNGDKFLQSCLQGALVFQKNK